MRKIRQKICVKSAKKPRKIRQFPQYKSKEIRNISSVFQGPPYGTQLSQALFLHTREE